MLMLAVSVLQRYGVALFFGTPFGILLPARRSPSETDRSPHPV